MGEEEEQRGAEGTPAEDEKRHPAFGPESRLQKESESRLSPDYGRKQEVPALPRARKLIFVTGAERPAITKKIIIIIIREN